jgi:hypothetical protein
MPPAVLKMELREIRELRKSVIVKTLLGQPDMTTDMRI